MKKIIYILSLILLIFSSCKDNINNEIRHSVNTDKIVLTDDEFTSIAYDNPKEITESDIKNIITEFQQINAEAKNTGFTRSHNVVSTLFKNKYYISKSNNNILSKATTRSTDSDNIIVPIYEVELTKSDKEKDFVVVCGDERASKVLFYVDNYSPEEKMNLETAYLLELSKRSAIEDIELVEKIKKEKRNSTLERISNKLNIPIEMISYDLIKDKVTTASDSETRINSPGGVSRPTTRIISSVSPMTYVMWNQVSPYNKQMPKGYRAISNNTAWIEDQNYVVGCANVAIATLFTIIQPAMVGVNALGRQILIDWNYVTSEQYLVENPLRPQNNSEPRKVEMVGSLMRKIYNDTESYPELVSITDTLENNVIETRDCFDMTSTSPNKMIEYFNKWIKFSGDGYTLFNADLVRNSLASKKPVFLWGSGRFVDNNDEIWEPRKEDRPGHAWLIDGYVMTKPSSQSKNDIYWSVNMGWGNKMSKGYFKTGSDPNNCNVVFQYDYDYNVVFYTIDQRIIYDIEKK